MHRLLPTSLAAALLALPALESLSHTLTLALAPAAQAQGKSHLAPGRQRGNPNPGRGKGHNKGWDDHGEGSRYEGRYDSRYDSRDDSRDDHWDRRWSGEPEWYGWNRERWRLYNRTAPVHLWSQPVRVSANAYRPVWVQPNWIEERPWPTGWYGGWRQPPWRWWPAQSSVWGVGSLATSSLINRAISQALGWGQPTILVPATSWRLLYGSVQPQGYAGVSFVVSNGAGTYRMGANCNSGLLNGQVPTTVGQAQLLHSACQVAYGGPGY
jgi:hypothetical protein